MISSSKILGNYRKVIHTGNLLICAKMILRRRFRVLHVGAHAAQERTLYSRFGVDDVYWVEPIPHLVKELRESLPEDRVIPFAVWSGKQTMKLLIAKNEVSSSFYKFADTNPFENQETVREVMVQTITLDNIIEQFLPDDKIPLVLVLDIQGSEYEALCGLSKKNTRKILGIVIEVSEIPVYEGAASAKRVRMLLKKLGYVRNQSLVRPPTNHGDELFFKRNQFLGILTIIRSSTIGILFRISLWRYKRNALKN
jgi:FkbM family methyltransferase